MGRGALAKVRWKNDRIRKKKDRDKRQALAGGKAKTIAAATSATSATTAATGGTPATNAGPAEASETSEE